MLRWSTRVRFFSLVFAGAFAFGACGDDLIEGTTGASDSDATEGSSATSGMTTVATTEGPDSVTEGMTTESTTVGTTFGPDTDPLTTTATSGLPTSVGPATESSTDSQGTDTEGTTDGTATDGGTDTDGGGACCEPHEGLGCDDGDIESCVCEQDAFCCETAWDELCVEEVDTFGCGSCGIMPDSCCAAHMEPGCSDPDVAACVCEAMPQCCEESWGPECVAAVDMMQCGLCEMDAGDCCVENGSPSCNQPDVAGCVCEAMPECCEDVWSQACADSVEMLGCGLCEQQLGPCCEPGNGPGCEDADVAACVCDVAPGCCENEWNEVCADLVGFLGCGSCNEGDCCAANDTPGCGDPVVESCVCEAAPSCCQNPWSDACAVLVEQLGCGMCGGMMFDGDCCVANGTPGCDDADVTECVCALDPFCCENEWDDLCAGAAVEQCGAQCP
ncbi:MAG: hypothetical protein H6713_42520 [Myxococcales bacterium]|nr:hypothetical protein [Myxococcales bacterium]MCB9756638.1 hypothetical protein [Myxococcales bacterium]